MELRTGYKNTEVGIIPEDWRDLTFKDVSWVNQGLQIPISRRLSLPTKNSKVYITIQYLNDGKSIEYIDDYVDSVCCSKDDVLMTRTGNTGIVVTGVDGVFHNNFFKINFNREKIDKNFLVYYLNQSKTKKIILAKAGTSTIPDLNHSDFYSIPIPLPPTKAEQTAIATALSDADDLINSLEKLIAKKRNIKQGAMQQLLKPKEGWEVKKLPELVWFQEGPGVRNSQFTYSGVKLLNGTNIEDGKLLLEKTDRYISEKEANGWYSHFLVDDGDILIACSGVSIDKFGEKVTIANSVHLPLCMNTSTMRFQIISKELSKNFFFHFLKSKSFKSQIGGKATGSAQLNFGPSHVKMVDISFPKIERQNEIATILSDMDDEIQALETKLEKYRKIKLGMMQNLLTGKIRLV
ncbi:MAG: restriction endonuclease subunit S [Bacteroidales bacterium]|nr:restriction endonuclease subunit S [Bacteroidales bacterium]